jgi:hypothetical protein
MNLTRHELAERARAIWGSERFVSARLREDRGADITLLQARTLASDTRGRNFTAHQLDVTGTPKCHDDCKTLVLK